MSSADGAPSDAARSLQTIHATPDGNATNYKSSATIIRSSATNYRSSATSYTSSATNYTGTNVTGDHSASAKYTGFGKCANYTCTNYTDTDFGTQADKNCSDAVPDKNYTDYTDIDFGTSADRNYADTDFGTDKNLDP